MSGGVDSSVSAALLQKEGYNVSGIMMKIWKDGRHTAENPLGKKIKHGCYGPEEVYDIEDAKMVANKLGIPLHIFDLSEEYQSNIINYVRKEYMRGRTPNPCVICNHTMKSGLLIESARNKGLEFDYFATGHYVRKFYCRESKIFFLKKAVDQLKDQTYFLSYLAEEQIESCLFPLGNYTKEDVRKFAMEMDIPVALKGESQDFISGKDYTSIFNEIPGPGNIIDEKGKVLGTHKGIIYYTIGQRKGLNISSVEPLYVKRISHKENTITVAHKESIYSKALTAYCVNWLLEKKLGRDYHIKAKIRQNHKEAPAVLNFHDECHFSIVFEEPQLAITPGQTVAVYIDDIVIGAGIIE